MGAERLGIAIDGCSAEEFDGDVVTETGREGGWLVIGALQAAETYSS